LKVPKGLSESVYREEQTHNGQQKKMFTTSGTYPWSFVAQIFHNGQPSHGGDCKAFEVMTSIYPRCYM